MEEQTLPVPNLSVQDLNHPRKGVHNKDLKTLNSKKDETMYEHTRMGKRKAADSRLVK